MPIYIPYIREVNREFSDRIVLVYSTEREAVYYLLKKLLNLGYLQYSCKAHYSQEDWKPCDCFDKIFNELKKTINTVDKLKKFSEIYDNTWYQDTGSKGWTFYIDEAILVDNDEESDDEDEECLDCKNSEYHCRDCSNTNCKSKTLCYNCNKD